MEIRAPLVTGPGSSSAADDTLAYRLVEHLVERYNGDVTVIMPSATGGQAPRIAALPGVRVVESERPTAEAYERADLAHADALALVEQNDGGNVDARSSPGS